MKFKTVLSLIPAIMLCGCFWGGSSSTTCVYDLGVPAAEKKLPYRIDYKLFRNLSGADRRFLVRSGGGAVRSDEFSRWLLDPELLLERYLRSSVTGRGDEVVSVRGILIRFETDLKKREAVLQIDFVLSSGGRRREVSCSSRKSFADGSWVPLAASAMDSCAADIARQLCKEIKLFMEKK